MKNIIILGSGCAGLTAALYAARGALNPLVIEGPTPGGLLTTTTTVENFPGFPDGVDGYELTTKIRQQAIKFGAEFRNDLIEKVDFSGKTKILFGQTAYETRAVIIATGATPRLLGVKGEKEFYTKGVHTCATCDGAFYRGKEVVVVGGGDSACEEAHFLSRFATHVTIIHRRDTLRASKVMIERVKNEPKISFIWDSTVEEFLGDKKVSSIRLRNLKTSASSEFKTDGAFLAVGHVPQTRFLRGTMPMDEAGYLTTISPGIVRTSVAGIWVAGDCADPTYRQAITAAGMGAMAAIEAEKFLSA